MAKEELRTWQRKIKTLIATLEDYSLFASQFCDGVNNLAQVRVRLDEIGEFSERFEDYQGQVEMIDDKTDEEWIKERRAFRNQLCDSKAALFKILDDHAKAKEEVTTPSVSSITPPQQLNSFNAMRYPPCALPTFNGDWQQWSSFIDTFNSMFHNEHTNLPMVQRFHYLKSCLKDQASDVIKSIPTTAENFQRAYDLLVSRYENKGAIIQSHIRALLDTPKVVTPSSLELQKLHHHITSHVNALRSLHQPIEHWDAWLVTLLHSRMDSSTVGEWYLQYKMKELPSYTVVEDFLINRISAYEAGDIYSSAYDVKKPPIKNSLIKNQDKRVLFTKQKVSNNSSSKSNSNCPICSAAHKLYACEQFNKMSIPDRKLVIVNLKLCYNCLNAGHQVKTCNFPPCPKCGKRHNSKIHDDSSVASASSTNTPSSSTHQSAQESSVLYTELQNQMLLNSNASSVLLATSMVHIYDKFGKPQSCRAVLDSGSQLNFITNSCAERLQLASTHVEVAVCGVSSMSSSSVRLAPTILSSRCGYHKFTIDMHTTPVIAQNLPTGQIDQNSIAIPEKLKCLLADPQFHTPSPVDILLGAEVFFDIFTGEQVNVSSQASLHNTKFGWILTGRCLIQTSKEQTGVSMLSTTALDNSSLALFSTRSLNHTDEESKAEEHFRETHTRSSDGRFIVKLPLNENAIELGESRVMAMKRFFNLERRMQKDEPLARQYNQFMTEYFELNHLEPVNQTANGPVYYLPYHPVFKASSLTTKMRVVFDGSASTKSGLSLNDILLKGPKVQPDIFHILLRFRMHNVAITADVTKMYRQILVAPEDRDLQRIVYRSSPSEQLKDYRLCTVTYGTKCASFLATRCLAEIGRAATNSTVQRVVAEDFYVDDLISGGDSDDKCYELYEQLLCTLNSAGLPLRKWCSSSLSLMNRIPSVHNDPTFMLKLQNDETISALGLAWQPSCDQFRFLFKKWTPPVSMTKRSLLSDINSVYDPLGLISPVLILGKIFIQQLWGMKMSWDDVLPLELQNRWIQFYSNLQSLDNLCIPRKVVANAHSRFSIHGFCDASKEAYGACLYIRSTLPSDTGEAILYTSKSRVAPMSATTIPRLELCGALLLAELISEAVGELKRLNIHLQPQDVFLWTDSTIVLAWIQRSSLLQVYVSNRVARILDVTLPSQWRHVPTSDNPADIISRGVEASAIKYLSQWWQGPTWLSQESSAWPKCPDLPSDLPETRTLKLVLSVTSATAPWLIDSYSSWTRLLRITALIKRFVFNCLQRRNKERRRIDFITTLELEDARRFWIIKAQAEAFTDEISSLKNGQPVPRRSCLKQLNPFLDSYNLIRVGGRIANAAVPYCMKHPIALPSKSQITKLIFKYEHVRLLHIGPQALLSHIHNDYWPIRGRNIARNIVSQCIQCFRSNPKFSNPFMAPLPRERVNIERPFSRTGIDYCGPVMIRSGLRKVTPIKGYICVYVCMVTRAVHLELVPSLSSEDFLSSLSRFMSRRGQCSHLYSDNGTNFVGADRILQKQFCEYHREHKVHQYLTNKGIIWHFIPPSAPHFGGLWEAAVKSAKRHLLCTTKGIMMTYDETNTLLCRIEAALNSRPLTPLSSDPNDFNALTPGHFLIGSTLMLPPEPDVSEIPKNRLHRFRLMQAQVQLFWKRWTREYLPQVQRRGKWTKVGRNAMVGDLAILRDQALPPIQWPLVRITKVHPGADNVVRVATVRNSSGAEFKRPMVKLALLPTDEDDVQEPEPNTDL